MPIDDYIRHPALKPTVLARDFLKNVYRPTMRDLPQVRPDATDTRIARETPRAA